MKPNNICGKEKVFHSFPLSVKKKPVEKVEKSVDNSKTRL